MYTIAPEITKEHILEQVSQSDIFQHYIGISPFHTCSKFKSPLRAESNASCMWRSSSKGTIRIVDYGGYYSFNCFELVKFLFHIKRWDDVYLRIASDLGIAEISVGNIEIGSPDPVPGNHRDYFQIPDKYERQPVTTTIRTKRRSPHQQDIAWWKRFLVTPVIMEFFHIYPVDYFEINDMIIHPKSACYGYYCFNDEWKIYQPHEDIYKWCGNTQPATIQGYHQLPERGELLFIQKGLKDVATMKAIGQYACAPVSENTFLSKEQLAELNSRFDQVVVWFDNDERGRELSKVYENEGYKTIFTPSKKEKDISDFADKYGWYDTLDLVNSLIKSL